MLKTFAAAALAFSLAGGPAVFIPDRAAHADAGYWKELGLYKEGSGYLKCTYAIEEPLHLDSPWAMADWLRSGNLDWTIETKVKLYVNGNPTIVMLRASAPGYERYELFFRHMADCKQAALNLAEGLPLLHLEPDNQSP